MAELTFESPVTNAPKGAGQGAVTVGDESSTHKASVRAADGTAAATALGLSFASSEHRGEVFVAHTRPEEWMIFGSADAVASTVDGLDLAGYASTVDITHSRLMFRLTGANAANALGKLMSADITDSMMPDGAIVGGTVASVGCDVIRDDVDGVRSYRIICDRSFGQYLFESLVDAKAEFDN